MRLEQELTELLARGLTFDRQRDLPVAQTVAEVAQRADQWHVLYINDRRFATLVDTMVMRIIEIKDHKY